MDDVTSCVLVVNSIGWLRHLFNKQSAKANQIHIKFSAGGISPAWPVAGVTDISVVEYEPGITKNWRNDCI